MKPNRIRTTVVAVAVAAALPVSLGAMAPQALAATPTPSTPSSTGASTSPSPSSSESTSPGAAVPFGPDCSSVPKTGSGSLKEMAKEKVATAASHNPQLATLVTALKKAGLTDTLNSSKHLTVFAPTNAAFEKVPKAQLAKLLADKAELAKVLKYHVVDKTVTPDELPKGTFKTLEGTDLTTSGSGSTFKVNDTADIVCGNIKTENATVYLVDSVLMPK
ncbi:fasciclin domain-containing protein [Streptomyces corynorhini]|uniref:Fasciclin domain-containing protein n=1 Tax=Streptomyces corynorhini TaxID=2282652 RepID=A0A370B9C2_9ACTN|nr:fasciclin domain-containing protein [Streptomyces corynorhini]RDG36979.1 fasciclin domain-containing protein [Streptomyces corynorhini]